MSLSCLSHFSFCQRQKTTNLSQIRFRSNDDNVESAFFIFISVTIVAWKHVQSAMYAKWWSTFGFGQVNWTFCFVSFPFPFDSSIRSGKIDFIYFIFFDLFAYKWRHFIVLMFDFIDHRTVLAPSDTANLLSIEIESNKWIASICSH